MPKSLLAFLVYLCAACASGGSKPAQPVATTAAQVPPRTKIPSAWEPDKQAFHALRRLSYGPRPGDIRAVGTAGVDRWIRVQLAPSTLNDEVVDAKLRRFPANTLSPAELHLRYPNAMEIERELVAEKMIRAVDSNRQLQEVLVDFWFNHFNVDIQNGQERYVVTAYERDVIRPHVFGKFRELLGATAKSAAMLFYLDNWMSAPNADLNDAYARALLEQHTIGVGYSPSDVHDVARAFSGWSVEEPDGSSMFVFRGAKHDDGPKTVLGQPLPQGGGVQDGERVLDVLASDPRTARSIAFALCEKFVSDDPPIALVDKIAKVFTQTQGDLTAVYEAIFFSPEFWSEEALESKVKTPLELAVSSMRAVGATTDGNIALPAEVARMGQPLYRSKPPTGYAEASEAWVTTGALSKRLEFGLALASGQIRGVSFDREKFMNGVSSADLAAEVDLVTAALVHHPLDPPTRQIIIEALGHLDPVGARQAPQNVNERALGFILGCPEYQMQ
jgi:uncharacterized protein (DUF1800 family)